MSEMRCLISIVDDDESVRESLPDLLRELGFRVEAFSSAEMFLTSPCVGETSCLVLDVVLPGMSGVDLRTELLRLGFQIPVVYITAQSDPQMRPKCVEQSRVAYLVKPFSDVALETAVLTAMQGH